MGRVPGVTLELHASRLLAARRVEVARQVSVAAAPGDVVAVEGVNGSGKSTLLAAAAGLLPAGRDSRHPPAVGYAPERGDTPTRLPVRRWLPGLARTAGLSRPEAEAQVDDLLDRLGLDHASARPLRTLSRGNLQRALIAQALIGPPDLLVLDEPGGGLDDDGIRRLAAERSSKRPGGPRWCWSPGTLRRPSRCRRDRRGASIRARCGSRTGPRPAPHPAPFSSGLAARTPAA
jgi:ATPase subunit of ABC transporter with duplicated ATPase domains